MMLLLKVKIIITRRFFIYEKKRKDTVSSVIEYFMCF